MIFVKISSIFDAIPKLSLLKARYSSAFLLGFSFLIFCSCTTTKTVPIESIRKDTIYLSNLQYDSIYIYKERTSEFIPSSLSREERGGSDTLLIRETNTEYKYKLLKDTIYKVRVDSIPYEVKVIETKEVRKPPNIFDYLCYLSFGILIGITGWKMSRLL